MSGEKTGSRIWKTSDVRQGDEAERPVARAQERVAVLPHGLQRPEGPAEALRHEPLRVLGGLRPADRVVLVADPPAPAADRDREVGVLGHGVRGEAPDLAQHTGAPGAERPGDDRDAVEQVEGALLEVLAGHVLEGLPAGDPAVAVARPSRCPPPLPPSGRAKCGTSRRTAVRLDGGVRVDRDHDLALRLRERVVEGGGLAPVRLPDEPHPRVAVRPPRGRARRSRRWSRRRRRSPRAGRSRWRGPRARSRRWPPPRRARARGCSRAAARRPGEGWRLRSFSTRASRPTTRARAVTRPIPARKMKATPSRAQW